MTNVTAKCKCEIGKVLLTDFKKRVVIPAFYAMKWKWQAYSTRDEFLVLTKCYLDCTFAEPEEGSRSR